MSLKNIAYRTIEPKTEEGRLNISEYVSDLEGILTSVLDPFQVRFRSVPYNGREKTLNFPEMGDDVMVHLFGLF